MALGVCVLVAGCSTEQPANVGAVRVVVTGAGQGPIGIDFGDHWIIGGSLSFGPGEQVRAPADARVVTAYIDLDRDGRLSRFSEPSANCVYVPERWECHIVQRRATLYRTITKRSEWSNDKTTIFWEDYTDGGERNGSEICVNRQCSRSEASPFINEGAGRINSMSICGAEGFEPSLATVKRKISGEMKVDGDLSSFPVARPPALHLTAIYQREVSGQGTINIESGESLDRILVWAGRFRPNSTDPYELLWTSESSLVVVRATPGQTTSKNSFSVEVPVKEQSACSRYQDCEIVIQAVKYWSDSSIPTSLTEIRQVVYSSERK